MPSGARATSDEALDAYAGSLCESCLVEAVRAVDAVAGTAQGRAKRAARRYRQWLAEERRIEGASWEPLLCAGRLRDLVRAQAAASEAWRQKLALWQAKGSLVAHLQLLVEDGGDEEPGQGQLF